MGCLGVTQCSSPSTRINDLWKKSAIGNPPWSSGTQSGAGLTPAPQRYRRIEVVIASIQARRPKSRTTAFFPKLWASYQSSTRVTMRRSGPMCGFHVDDV